MGWPHHDSTVIDLSWVRVWPDPRVAAAVHDGVWTSGPLWLRIPHGAARPVGAHVAAGARPSIACRESLIVVALPDLSALTSLQRLHIQACEVRQLTAYIKRLWWTDLGTCERGRTSLKTSFVHYPLVSAARSPRCLRHLSALTSLQTLASHSAIIPHRAARPSARGAHLAADAQPRWLQLPHGAAGLIRYAQAALQTLNHE